ncbi:hypothetical protein ZYGR_0AY01570 [Zygosaccharomyces rouxii]|uniref:DUF1279 domain-containing protein n=1 Tax=Zygosaccharomyces rouxii TaxID=4956 RepID=A0A1Q3AJ66_ZYGRO|nr:hypothetical protein ZYGR_0AY01570 [Zygosaccharomyces rouxii]
MFRSLPGLRQSLLRAGKARPMGFIRCQSRQAQKPKSIKELMSTYGYSALGVYLGLSLIDLPLCFLMVHSLGEETISVYLNKSKQVFGFGKSEDEVIREVREKLARKQVEDSSQVERSWWQEFKQSTLLAEFLIAYGIHKSLIFIRLPITAAITPPTVRLLQKWGFNIGPQMFKTMSKDANLRYKSGNPSDFIKPTNGNQPPRNPHTKGQKWFNGMM